MQSSSSASSSSTNSPRTCWGNAVSSSSSSIHLRMETLRIGAISPFQRIENIHTDDIHGFISSESGFISGSKDNSMGMWNTQGELIKRLVPGRESSYEFWVTALHRFSNNYWASGTRDGRINVWDRKGDKIREWKYLPEVVDHRCKSRNLFRINCIKELQTGRETTTFYTGHPTHICLWDAKTKSLIKSYGAAKNDWVYCIETLPDNRLLVVFGSTLQIWDMTTERPKKTTLIQEAPTFDRKAQRKHISSITLLEQHLDQLACTVFDGSVRLVDLSTQRELKSYEEHEGRTWSVVNLQEHILATCADDRTIKIWDVRMPYSVHTLGGNPGRVSSLLQLNANTLISGSCPDNLRTAKNKASVTFWDIRSLVETGADL